MLRLPTLPDRLPQLRGRWMVAYVTIWLLLLPIAVAVPLAGSWLRYEDGAGSAHRDHPLGFEFSQWRVERVASMEARAAGLRPGDRIVAVEGVAVSAERDQVADYALVRRLAAREGESRRLTVVTGSGPPRQIVLHHRAANAEPFYRGTGWTADSISLASAMVPLLPWFVLVSGAILLFTRRRDPGAALFSLTFLALAHNMSWASQVWGRLGLLQVYMLLGPLGSVGLLWSLLAFPRGRFEPRWSVWLAAFAGLSTVVSSFGVFAPAVNDTLDIAIPLSTIITLAIRYRRETAAERRQWRWALLAIPIGLGLTIFGMLVYTPYLLAHKDDPVVSMWSWIITPGLSSLSVAVVSAGVLLSVLRYRIYAAQSAISRSLVYGTLTLALLAIFAASEKVIELVGEEYFGESLGALAGGLAAAFAAVAIVPLHHRISQFVEQRLRKDLIALRRDLPPILEAEAENGTPSDVAATALTAIARAVHAERGAIVDGDAVLACIGADDASGDWPVAVTLGHGGSLRLLIGTKPDDSLYDRDERDAIADLAEPVARAIRAAHRTRELDARLDRIENRLETLLRGRGLAAS